MLDGVVILPDFFVNGDQAPRFEKRSLLDSHCLNQFLAKRYPGMTLAGQPREVDNYGLLAFSDDRRFEQMENFKNLASAIRVEGRGGESRELEDEIDRAFIRRPTWREAAMDRNVNNYRR